MLLSLQFRFSPTNNLNRRRIELWMQHEQQQQKYAL